MPGYRVLRLDEIAARTDEDDGAEWLPVRDALGVRAFGINAWRGARAGAQIIERHDEAGPDDDQNHEELYLVLSGSARFSVGGEEIAAPAGTLVFVADPALERGAVAEADGTVVLSIGAQVGVSFEVSPWERRELA